VDEVPMVHAFDSRLQREGDQQPDHDGEQVQEKVPYTVNRRMGG